MLFNCGCNQRVLDVPTKLFFMLEDEELNYLCSEGIGCQISNPFFKSYVASKGIEHRSEKDQIVTSKEYEQMKEDEYDDPDDAATPDLNLPPDFFEE